MNRKTYVDVYGGAVQYSTRFVQDFSVAFVLELRCHCSSKFSFIKFPVSKRHVRLIIVFFWGGGDGGGGVRGGGRGVYFSSSDSASRRQLPCLIRRLFYRNCPSVY